jgi:catechol 2,3-dioxygenase-like lactoylglutathione lyase family enzyme
MYKTINGIQHIGIGVPNHAASWKWYRQYLGMDICFFNGAAEAPLMKRYTKDQVINKQAAMITNLDGGCAMELVSPISFTATHASTSFELGDLGIFVGKVKTSDITKSYAQFKDNNQKLVTDIIEGPMGQKMFYFEDPNGLLYQVTEGNSKEWFFKKNYHTTGGPQGVIIGVSSIDNSMKLYADLLGYSKVVFDETKVFEDFAKLPGGNKTFRRVLLTQADNNLGGFSRLTGSTYIELVQAMDYSPK